GLARRPNANLEQEFDRIEQETGRLDELIGEILSLSRLDDPAHTLIAEPVNLEELLETLLDNARVEAEPPSISVQIKAPAALSVEGDRELLFRAIENVLRNAVRFSPNGAVVELAAERGADQVVVRVTDHGPGVPPASLERIFEPFFCVARARDRDSGGYGIGLAITARVAALHGGSVRARNNPDGGPAGGNPPAAISVQSMSQIRAQILDRLDADRQATQRIGYPQGGACLARHAGMGHDRRMFDQALDSAERLGQREQLAALKEAPGGLDAAF